MEDILAIISLFVILPTIVFSFAYRMRKLKSEERIAEAQVQQLSVGGGEELRMSELQALIDDAVDEATASLEERIAVLEGRQMEDPDLLTGESLNSYQAPNAAPVLPKTVGRTRS